MEINEITGAIVDAAMKVHSTLGPRMLESVYEKCLMHELAKRGFKVQNQLWLPVITMAFRSRVDTRLTCLSRTW